MSQTEVLESLKWMTPFERLAVVERFIQRLGQLSETQTREINVALANVLNIKS